MPANENLVIVLNSNLSLVEGRGRERIYRVLAYSESHVCLHELGTVTPTKTGESSVRSFVSNPPPRGIRSRLVWHRADVEKRLADGTLIRVAEHGIPVQMVRPEVPPGVDVKLDLRRHVVAHIQGHGGVDVLGDPGAYARLIRTAAARFNVSANSVRKWFESHLFYGGHVNALIDQDWRKGAPGVSRRDLRDDRGRPVALGRRTDSEMTGQKGAHARKRLTSQMLTKYSNFLRVQAIDSNDPFPIVYRRWVESRVAFNRDSDGNLRTYPVDPKTLPGEDNMKRVGRALLRKYRAERDALRRSKPGKNGGSAQDIVHDQLPILDIDGTVASNFILFGDEQVEIDGQGKPTVLLAVDRASLAIVGWHVSLGAENGDSYLNCVFSACTSKVRELHRWEVPHLEGFVFGCTSAVFIDRGPGISMKTQSSLVGRFRTAAKMAEPGSPQSKGHAEQVMRYFQEALTDLSGSTFTTGNSNEDRVRQKHARKGAVPLKVFMQALLTAISRRNLESDARHLLTTDMMKNRVLPCPAEIYRYNKARRRGDAAWDWAPEDVFRKLCVSRELKAPRGVVSMNQRKFSSRELALFARSHAALHNDESVKITTYEIPNAPFVLLWELPGHGLGLLEATPSTKKLFEDGLEFSIEYQNNLRNHLFAEAKLVARKHAQAAASAARKMPMAHVSKAQQAKIDLVERRAVPAALVGEGVASTRTQARRHLERSDVDSMLSGFQPTHALQMEAHDSVEHLDQLRCSINDEQDLLLDI